MDLIKLFQKQPQSATPVVMAQKQLGYPDRRAFQFLSGNWVLLQENYSTYIDKGFKNIPYVYAIVDQIAEKFSDAPRELMRVKNKKMAKGYDQLMKSGRTTKDFFMAKMLMIKAMEEVPEDHPYYILMNSPNPITPTEKTFNYMRCGYLALTGNNYAYAATPGMGPNANAPKQWWIVPSPTCAPIVGDYLDPIKGYRTSYFELDEIAPELIQHVKLSNFMSSNHSLEDTLVGMSPMRPLITTNSQLTAAERANGIGLTNMAPAGLLSGEAKDELSEEDGGKIQEGFTQRHTGQEEYKKIIVSPTRIHWTEIGFSPVEMQILEFMDKAEERIAKVYHYPLGLLNSKGEVANETINSRRMITDAVLPYIRRFDDADTQAVKQWYNDQNLKVVTDLQYFPELQEDMVRISTWLKDAYWLTLEEKRQVMDYQEQWKGTMLIPSGLDSIENILAKPLDGGNEDEL